MGSWWIRKWFADPDLALDVGTANTRIFNSSNAALIEKPSAITISVKSGGEQEELSIYPLHGGVVTNVDAAATLLRPMILKTRRLGIVRPRILACAPTDATEEEQDALISAITTAGAAAVALAPEPMAAAIGASVDVGSGYAQVVVDIGHGVTDIAVIRSGKLLATAAIRTACSDLHIAARNYVAERHRIQIGAKEAIRLTRSVGALYADQVKGSLVVTGHDSVERRADAVVALADIATALQPVIASILQTVVDLIRDLPASVASEVIESGAYVTGGGACLPGMMERIAHGTNIDVRSAADPLHSVIRGAKEMLSVARATSLWTDSSIRC